VNIRDYQNTNVNDPITIAVQTAKAYEVEAVFATDKTARDALYDQARVYWDAAQDLYDELEAEHG
jgi:hypothetical protein